MADQLAHQIVEDVVVDRYSLHHYSIAHHRWPRQAAAALFIAALACAPEPPAPPPTTATTATTAPPPAAPPRAEVKCAAAPGVLCPADEGPNDASFEAYRDKLIAAVEKKDRAALDALVDPHVRTSFGGDGGTGNVQWGELAQILPLGGTFQSASSFWAPYVYSTWPDEVDAFTHVAAVRPGVALREQPSASARSVRTLDWSILELLDSKPGEWRHVKTADGATGWVESKDVRSPIGYRAGFNKTEKGWTMTALVAGD